MNLFTKIYRFCWIVLIMMLIFFDRGNQLLVIMTLLLLFILSIIAILRFLEARNEWRKYIKEESLDDNIH